MGKFYRYIFKPKELYYLHGGWKIKRENCPFCGHRWIRSSDESPITCPNCKNKYYRKIEFEREEIIEYKSRE